MTKLEEVIAKYNYDNDSFLSIESMMRDYADYYVKECLKIAAVCAKLRVQGVTSLEEYKTDHIYSNDGLQDLYVDIDVDSILNIKLPEHD